jgi:hypothetical protein
LPARLAELEMELSRVRQERAAEADDMAAMLVRIAAAERQRTAALDRAAAHEDRVRALEAIVAELQRPRPAVEDPRIAELVRELAEVRSRADSAELALEAAQSELQLSRQATQTAWGRAALAERSSADATAALALAHAELEADRKHVVDLEANLARIGREHTDAIDRARRESADAIERARRERGEALEAAREASARAADDKHAQTVAALREELAAAKRASARALEEERSATARARQHASALEASVASSRETVARAKERLEELARREEMAASLRVRSIADALGALGAPPLEEAPSPAAPARGSANPIEGVTPSHVRPSLKQAAAPVSRVVPESESGSLDDIEIDLAD